MTIQQKTQLGGWSVVRNMLRNVLQRAAGVCATQSPPLWGGGRGLLHTPAPATLQPGVGGFKSSERSSQQGPRRSHVSGQAGSETPAELPQPMEMAAAVPADAGLPHDPEEGTWFD